MTEEFVMKQTANFDHWISVNEPFNEDKLYDLWLATYGLETGPIYKVKMCPRRHVYIRGKYNLKLVLLSESAKKCFRYNLENINTNEKYSLKELCLRSRPSPATKAYVKLDSVLGFE